MAANGSVLINFKAKADQAIRETRKLVGALKKVDGQAGSTGKKLKIGLAAGAAAAGTALLGAGAALVEFGQAAIEDYKSAEKLADTLATIPGVTREAIAANEEWISSMQIATNVADTDLRQAVSKAALVTKDLGEAQKIAAAAADLAAITGKPYAAVADAMAKAAAGNTTQLKRMAPWLDTNRDKTLTFAEAMGQLGGKYQEAAEKAADRDPWERIKTIFGEIKESLGQFAIPLIERFGNWFKDKKNQKAIQDWIDKVGEFSTKLGEDLVDAIQQVYSWFASPEGQKAIRDWGSALQTAADAVNAIAGAVGALGRAWSRLPEWARKLLTTPINKLVDPRVTGPGGSLWKDTPTTAPTPTTTRKPTAPRDPRSKDPRGSKVTTSSVTINNYYPKPETASSNLAASLRTARLVSS